MDLRAAESKSVSTVSDRIHSVALASHCAGTSKVG